ncbi:MAG: energy transducer TonB [Planctomycetota bacterium]
MVRPVSFAARRGGRSWFGRLQHSTRVLIGAASLTALFFLVLPFLQAITGGHAPDTMVRSVDTGRLPPPEAPPEPEPDPEDKPEEPPKLEDSTPQQLDLSQMELSLNPSTGGGWMSSDMAMKLDRGAGGGKKEVEALFALADLDQEPRVVYYSNPTVDPALKRKTPATVYLVFVVDQNGRVDDPRVQKSKNPVDPRFESLALASIKKWRFEPGKRNGKAVRFRMRLPFTFPNK